MEKKELKKKPKCKNHCWSIIEDFYTQYSRAKRLYAAYCPNCLECRGVEIRIEEEK